MHVNYAVVRGRLGVCQLAPNHKPGSIVRGPDNHKTGILSFMMYNLFPVGTIRKFSN